MFTLYKLTFSSGKSYIGQTVRKMTTRMAQHKQSALRGNSQLPVHCAWRKHGAPTVEVIGQYETQEALHLAEISAIEEHKTLWPNGYNVCHGGETAPSKSPEVAKKIAVKAKGRKVSHEVLAVLSEASKQHWANPEYREKVSKGLKNCWTEEMRAEKSRLSKELWAKRKAAGWKMPESQKEKLRQKVVSDETRAKMSAAAKGKPKAPRSAETCAKLSESTKAAWKNKEITDKRLSSIRNAWKDEDRVKDLSEKAKLSWKNEEVRAKRLTAMRKPKSEKD